MGLLSTLGLAPATALAGAPVKPDGIAPTMQERGERDRLTKDLKEAVPRVKALLAGNDDRAAEAAKLARETGDLLSRETLAKAREKLDALMSLIDRTAGVPKESPRRAPKTDIEISLEEFVKDLTQARGNIDKMRQVAKATGADKLADYLGKVGNGLKAFSDKAGKVVKVAKLASDIQEFRRALQVARGLDLNKDYEAAAIAMGDLANIGGKLAKNLAGEVPGLEAYFTLLQNAGAVWEAGARLHKKTDEMFVATGKTDPTTPEQAPRPKAVAKASTAEIPFEAIEAFMKETIAAVDKEAQWMGSVYSNELPDWELSTDAFLKSFAEFKPLHIERQADALGVLSGGRLSAKYRKLTDRMQAPYAEAMKHLCHLQDEIGTRTDMAATYVPVMKAMRKVAP